jgi:hypothetical protein
VPRIHLIGGPNAGDLVWAGSPTNRIRINGNGWYFRVRPDREQDGAWRFRHSVLDPQVIDEDQPRLNRWVVEDFYA